MTPYSRASKVALITGGAGALGGSHAHALAKAGHCVVVADIADPGPTVDSIRAEGGTAIGHQGGIDTWEGGAAAVDTALSTYGGLDVVVNNAGFLRDRTFAKLTPEMVDEVLAVHLHGAFHVTHAAWPHLGEGSSVIMTSSGTGLYGNVGQANYGAAKMGLIGLTRTLALEGARRGVRVNAIAPIARSPLTEDHFSEDLLQRLAPEWVSPLVVWLAAADCERTGNIYSVGGGRYARVAVLEGDGVTFDTVPSATDLAAAEAALDSLESATEPRSLADQIALVVPRAPAETAQQ